MKYVDYAMYTSDSAMIAADRPSHREYVAGLLGQEKLVASAQTTDSIVANDPFSTNGVFERCELKLWKVVFSKAFLAVFMAVFSLPVLAIRRRVKGRRNCAFCATSPDRDTHPCWKRSRPSIWLHRSLRTRRGSAPTRACGPTLPICRRVTSPTLRNTSRNVRLIWDRFHLTPLKRWPERSGCPSSSVRHAIRRVSRART